MTAVLAGQRAAGDRLARWADRLRSLGGWRQLGLALLLGALAATALPPLYLVPLLVPAFTGLVWLLEGCRGWKRAFLVGWAFAVGHHLVGLYWVGIAMTVDLARFWWFLPISVLGLAFGLGLFVALGTALLRGLGLRGPALVLGLAAAWLAGEFARGHVLTGFPWNLIGTVWTFDAVPMQAASLFGVWGLSAVTLLAALAPAVLAGPWRRRRRFVALSALPLAACLLFGVVRVGLAPPPGAAVNPDVRLRLVQPSISQQEKWQPTRRSQNVADQMLQSLRPGFEQKTLVIWSETAIPFLLNRDPDLQKVVSRVAPPGGYLLAGAPTLEPAPAGAPAGAAGTLYNSLYAIAPDGRVEARFDKVHLVPFGEYIPLRGLLKALGFGSLTGGNFSSGPGPRVLHLPGIPPFSPLICYEVIFPSRVYPPRGPRPDWLLNITNDAWFGDSSGPHQHFASAKLRTVEEGLPLVRDANNGISAVVDPYGRVLAELPLDAVGNLDSVLPRPLPPTLYARIGRWVMLPLLLLLLLPAVLLRGVPAAAPVSPTNENV
ncbi:Apolipoprotein N-acyltransferase [Tistlia consotensis]|uniref:Apolipoprotein N-acyltransferase n=1 Tax=Tistlia consotensis USBA 355 TaxID=560819 RepID=A0A1Y6CL17_9PROT|nr:apolipoprotein N-acyltransferase [Tistlia consotensis]SMF74476.1 Apolipoprotein N-acyltransferase [Tistlia consotensis USBA 355]SNS10690.1 Apolipoprotein N-acyltransferase [Tistlia consotensis]